MGMSHGSKQSAEHVRKRMESKRTTLATRPKPFDREWLRAKYIDDGLDCVQIGVLADRNSKTIWNWLKYYQIPTRPRGHLFAHLPKDGSGFRGKHHSEAFKADMRKRSIADGRVPYKRNGVHWLETNGAVHPNWKGGVSAERQAFYGSKEWKRAARAVRTRDGKTCQRCRRVKSGRHDPFDIHHIVSFEHKPLRAVVSNLILLCEPCHYWVHGRSNTQGEFIRCP